MKKSLPIITHYPLDFYINKIKSKEYFKFSRYGDGEWIYYFKILKQGQYINQEMSFDNNINNLLRKTINFPKESDSYFYGLQGLGLSMFGDKIPKLHWHDSDIFHFASINKEILPFLKILKENKLVFIGAEYLKKINTILPYDYFIEIPEKDCYKVITKTLKSIREYKKPAIYIFQCSIVTKILIYELDMPESFLLDLGSLLDPFVGHCSRSYHKGIIENGTINQYIEGLK